MHRMLRWSVCEGRERREWAEVAPEMHLGGKARDQGCFVLCRIRCDSGGKFTVYPPRARTSPLPSTLITYHNSPRHPRNKGLKRMIRLWIPGLQALPFISHIKAMFRNLPSVDIFFIALPSLPLQTITSLFVLQKIKYHHHVRDQVYSPLICSFLLPCGRALS